MSFRPRPRSARRACRRESQHGRAHAGRVGAGDKPDGRRADRRVAAISPAPGPRVLHDLASWPSSSSLFPPQRSARRRRSTPGRRAADAVAVEGERRVGADDDAQRLLYAAQSGSRADDGAGPRARYQTLLQASESAACTRRDGVALAAIAVEERLGERADDRRDGLGRGPVVEVPPDVIAVVDLGGGGALAGLDAVDVVEPVGRAGRCVPPRGRRSTRRSRRRSGSSRSRCARAGASRCPRRRSSARGDWRIVCTPNPA